MKESTAEKLISALERNSDEVEKFRRLLKPEISKTETLQRLKAESLDNQRHAARSWQKLKALGYIK